jgi:hypothetical protein
MQSSNLSVNEEKAIINIINHIIMYYLHCIGKAKSAREAGIFFIFPWVFVHWHSDFKVPCLNQTADKQFYLGGDSRSILDSKSIPAT